MELFEIYLDLITFNVVFWFFFLNVCEICCLLYFSCLSCLHSPCDTPELYSNQAKISSQERSRKIRVEEVSENTYKSKNTYWLGDDASSLGPYWPGNGDASGSGQASDDGEAIRDDDYGNDGSFE